VSALGTELVVVVKVTIRQPIPLEELDVLQVGVADRAHKVVRVPALAHRCDHHARDGLVAAGTDEPGRGHAG
jgi:hypothetical protein